MARHLTPAEYAESRHARGLPGGSRQAVHQAIADGRIQLVRGRIDPEIADEAWRASSGPETEAAPAPVNDISFNRARTITQTLRARKIQLEIDKELGKVYDREEAHAAAFDLGRRLQDMLMAMGPRLRVELARTKSPAQCDRIVSAEARRILEELKRVAYPAAGENEQAG